MGVSLNVLLNIDICKETPINNHWNPQNRYDGCFQQNGATSKTPTPSHLDF